MFNGHYLPQLACNFLKTKYTATPRGVKIWLAERFRATREICFQVLLLSFKNWAQFKETKGVPGRWIWLRQLIRDHETVARAFDIWCRSRSRRWDATFGFMTTDWALTKRRPGMLEAIVGRVSSAVFHSHTIAICDGSKQTRHFGLAAKILHVCS